MPDVRCGDPSLCFAPCHSYLISILIWKVLGLTQQQTENANATPRFQTWGAPRRLKVQVLPSSMTNQKLEGGKQFVGRAFRALRAWQSGIAGP